MPLDEAPAKSKSLFGSYDILETVGQGGMGLVYKAHDVNLGRIVALKILKEDLRTHAAIVERFRREGEAFASLNHPNIVHIYSVGTVGKIPYIAMEFIDGEPLSRRIKREQRLQWRSALKIGQQIAEALASAHDNHIIHRDIKPANILLTREGRAYVTDFGIAKILTAETNLTLDGTRLGTPQYMSPERCESQEVTAASDIYSLGIVLFQLIAGSLPYDAETPVGLIRQITTDPPKRLRELVPNVPKDVERLVAFMIEKSPRDRPKSAHEVAALIARVREGKPLVTNESGLREALEEFRDAMATPTPWSSSHFDSAGDWQQTSLVRRLRKEWRGLSDWPRTFIIAAIVAVIAATAGVFISQWLNRDYAIGLVEAYPSALDRWRESATVTEFRPENETQTVAAINLPDFSVGALQWFGESLAAALHGMAGSARGGQTALVTLAPAGGRAALLIPPGPAGLRLLGARDAAVLGGSELFVMSASSGERIFTATAIDGAPVLSPAFSATDPLMETTTTFSFGPVVALPGSDDLVMAVSGTGPAHTWTLLHRKADVAGGTATYVELAHPGLEIGALTPSPDGAVVYFLQSTGTQNELWAIDVARGDERLLRSGAFRIGGRALDDAGRRLAIVAQNGGDWSEEGVVKLLDASTGEEAGVIGSGRTAEWLPGSDSLLVSSRDDHGDLQLWRVSGMSPNNRERVTSIAGGIDSVVGVSSSGRWAAAGMAMEGNTPRILLIDLVPSPELDEGSPADAAGEFAPGRSE